jgi:predicted AlkP superfamily phosphohydrolase/phosphomutase
MILLGACQQDGPRPAGSASRRRVLILGLDGMDHGIVTRMISRGELPNLARLAREGGFRPLTTSIPPQSPTAWSNFITGARPGHHGIFDFIQRDPETLLPYLSTSRVDAPPKVRIGPLAIPMGSGSVTLLRQQKPFWWYLDRHGVPATVIRIPSHFPPRDDGEARVLSGMGTPDLLGTYGIYTLLTTDPARRSRRTAGGRIVKLIPVGPDRFRARLSGPDHPLSSQERPLELPVEVAVDAESKGVMVRIGDQRLVLGRGEWSSFVPVEFQVLSELYTLPAIVRCYLKSVAPEVELYISPLNLDPVDPALPISSPPDFARLLAQRAGRFYTQSMPEDTKALAEGVLSTREFLDQARLVLEQRKRLLWTALDDFDRGLLFFYFSSTDQISHMFFRAHDPTHAARGPDDERWAGVLTDIYRELDEVVGRAARELREDDLLLVMSDHGFGPASYLFDLNGWLQRRGYLALRTGPVDEPMGQIDWSKTQAYGVGLNGLYLNQRGRERHGVVPAARRDALLDRLSRQLLAVRHPGTGQRVVTQVVRPDRVYPGPEVHRAPDLIVGYGRGFKVHDLSATGGVGSTLFSINRNAWSGDHCGDRRVVPGILFSSRPLRPDVAASLVDLAPTVMGFFGVPAPRGVGWTGHDLLRLPARKTEDKDG